MSRGMTIAEFVQQVLYAMYKVRFDTRYSDETPQAFHADTDKFKETVMEANFVLQDFQKDQDWNWLRERWFMGKAESLPDGGIMEFQLPDHAYKICTGFNDAVRLHHPADPSVFVEVPFTSPRSGSVNRTSMFDQYGRLDVSDNRLLAFFVGDSVTFTNPIPYNRIGWDIETDIIRRFEPLHICDENCDQPCPRAYEDLVFTEIPDPQFMVVKTAAKRAEGDPSISDRVMGLTDEASKMLSAMRENDSSKTTPDTYQSIELGYTRIL